jgi:hypothetical protein
MISIASPITIAVIILPTLGMAAWIIANRERSERLCKLIRALWDRSPRVRSRYPG